MGICLQSAPAKALDLIFHGFNRKEGRVVILDYRGPATFQACWIGGLNGMALSVQSEDSTLPLDWANSDEWIVIAGNDPPDGISGTKRHELQNVDPRNHFAGTSWLAAWKVKVSPNVEFLLDLRSMRVSESMDELGRCNR